MLVVATAGLIGNAVSLWLLHDAQRQSLNMRGADLEVMGDLLGSAAVVVAAGIVALTDPVPADPIALVIVGLLIIPGTWRLPLPDPRGNQTRDRGRDQSGSRGTDGR